MKNIQTYAELEFQRRHLDGAVGKDREMVMSGINRLLDEILDSQPVELQTHLEPSEEGLAHLGRGEE